MAKQDKAAGRYAKALFDYLKDGEKIRAVVHELETFSRLMQSNHELKESLSSAIFSDAERRGIVEDLAKRMSFSDASRKALLVISDGRRLSGLDAIAKKLNGLLLDATSTVSLSVKGASQLSGEEKQKIEQSFQRLLGKKVEASYEVDSGLVGGLRVMAGGRTFDGSLAGWLASFKEQLAEGSI